MLFKRVKTLFNKIFKKQNKKIDNPILLLQESSYELSTFFYNNKEFIDKSSANLLVDDLNNYCDRLKSIINSFKNKNKLNNALKGKSREALDNYINNLINVLDIYTSSYNNLANNIDKYIKGDIDG